MDLAFQVLGDKIRTLEDDLAKRNASLSEAISEIEALRNEVSNLKGPGYLLGGVGENRRNGHKLQVMRYTAMVEHLEQNLKDTIQLNLKATRELDVNRAAHSAKVTELRNKNKILRDSKREVEKTLKILQDDVIKLAQEKDETILKAERAKFDHKAFLSSIKDSSCPAQPPLSDIKSYSKGEHFTPPKAARRLCTPDGIIRVDGNEIIWSTHGIGKGVVIMPTHRYDPTSTSEWIERLPDLCVGQRRDLFYKLNGSWYYMGTFDCVAEGVVDLDGLSDLSDRALEGNFRTTVMHSDLVPPFLRKMIPSMYSSGILKFRCHALHCTGFNLELYKALFGLAEKPVQIPGQPKANMKRPRLDEPDARGKSKRERTRR